MVHQMNFLDVTLLPKDIAEALIPGMRQFWIPYSHRLQGPKDACPARNWVPGYWGPGASIFGSVVAFFFYSPRFIRIISCAIGII
jgi:hypothetical protein